MIDLSAKWSHAWPEALAAWSRYTRLVPATLCMKTSEALKEGLSGSFAMIRFVDQRIVIDLESIRKNGLEEYSLEILAHEIGHHVYAPANATDNLRLIARIKKSLPGLERHTGLVANLYTDLLINDRLQRQSSLDIAGIYRCLAKVSRNRTSLWALYMRIYEKLWNLEKGSLCKVPLDGRGETDAWLGARLIRVYSREWLSGSGQFALLLLPYLLEQELDALEPMSGFSDLKGSNKGSSIRGIINREDDEKASPIHPAENPLISGEENLPIEEMETDSIEEGSSKGQIREPFEFGEILKAAGITLSDQEMAVAYYRERALPHILPYPEIQSREKEETLPEGIDLWGLGDPFDEIDYLQSLIQSPALIPGLTTVKRVYGTQPGKLKSTEVMDLDIYVDSSGSMANPQHQTSWLTLAGTIIALSALRAGARVQVTLWSGKSQVLQTPGFVSDEGEILKVLTGFFGGMTCFPIHSLRETYKKTRKRTRKTHILMISDEGITTMFDRDEKGNSGWDISAAALEEAQGGGTFVLNLPKGFGNTQWTKKDSAILSRACGEQGWILYSINSWEELLQFAGDFAQQHRRLQNYEK
jgi:hypothetical protein